MNPLAMNDLAALYSFYPSSVEFDWLELVFDTAVAPLKASGHRHHLATHTFCIS